MRFNNVSIQVNAENLYRLTSTFFPPEPQVSRESLLPPAVRWRHYKPVSLIGDFRAGRLISSRFSQALAEICHSGYVDALRFLQDNSKSSC